MVKQIIYLFIAIVFSFNDCSLRKTDFNKNESEDLALALGMLISGECLECDSLEMAAVGSVVLNRLCHPDYPNSIQEVIQEENQFHGYCSEQYMYVPKCHEIAVLLLSGVKRDTRPLFFWLKENKKPKYVSKILFTKKYHSFGI